MYSLPWSTFGSVPSVVQRIVSMPDPRSVAEKVTMTVFAYGCCLQTAPLQRTASVGAVASGASENVATPELSPAAFDDVTERGPVAVVPVLVET